MLHLVSSATNEKCEVHLTDRWRILALVNKVKLVLELEDIRESPKSKGDCHTTTDRKIIINIIYIYIKKERVHCLEGKLY